MNSTASRIRRKACARWWKSANPTGRIAKRRRHLFRCPMSIRAVFCRALTLRRARHTLKFQLAGRGSGEGRVNRGRDGHCDRLKSRKPGHPPVPQRAALFARRSDAASPKVSRGAFFVGEVKFHGHGRFVKEFARPRFRSPVFAAIAALLSCAALSRAQGVPPVSPVSPAFREVTDEAGRKVHVPQPVRRIVSLAPSLTETVYALGLQDRLVGDTDFCDYPPDPQNKPKVGAGINPSLQQISPFHPDLV